MATPETTIDIEDLPPPARTALARAINERRTPLMNTSGGGFILAGLCGAAALIFALYSGFGEPYSHHDEPTALIWYFAGFAGIIGAILLFRRKKTLRAILGFAPGVYALGSRLIDARTRQLKMFDLFAHDPHIVHRYVNGGYRHTTLTWHGFTFTFGRQAMAGEALNMLNANLQALRQAAQNNDIETMLALDPGALGVALAKSDAPPSKRPNKSNTSLLIAAAATLVLAPSTWIIRNYASQEVAFSNINTVYEADAWMQNGGDAERGKVKKMELEFRDVMSMDKEHADKLREVIDKYPDAPDELKKPALEALKARYEAARKTALGLSSSDQLTWFINQVYDRLEKTNAKTVMLMKVARTDNTLLAKLDEQVAADDKLKKKIVPVAKYFGTDADSEHTEKVKVAIQSGLAQFFPTDVMTFTNTEEKDQPTIEIFYVIRPKYTQDGYPSMYSEIDEHDKPVPGSLEYPGIEFELGATLQVPGAPGEPHKVTFTARPAPTISVEHSSTHIPGEDPATSFDNTAVYRAMADSAFADLQKKLVLALGGKPDPDAKADEAGDDNEPPECKAVGDKLTKFEACKTVAPADKKAADAALDKLANDKTTDALTICKKADAVLQKALDKAHCK